MKNPLRGFKRKANKLIHHRYTRIAFVATSATLAGTVASLVVGSAMARAPIHFGIRILAHMVTYNVASTITSEVLANEVELEGRDLREIVPTPPKMKRVVVSTEDVPGYGKIINYRDIPDTEENKHIPEYVQPQA